MPDSPYICTETHFRMRHLATYDNGVMVTTDANGLKSVCYYCRRPIVRVHRRSAWWRVEPHLHSKGE